VKLESCSGVKKWLCEKAHETGGAAKAQRVRLFRRFSLPYSYAEGEYEGWLLGELEGWLLGEYEGEYAEGDGVGEYAFSLSPL